MKSYNIFLASSDELLIERRAFGSLVYKLDQHLESQNSRLDIFEWEDYDPAYNGCRKQSEYNKFIPDSDIFIALFHTKAGKFTLEEFDIANSLHKNGSKPNIIIFCKELRNGEQELTVLSEFKKRLSTEGYSWSTFSNNNDLCYKAILQISSILGFSNDISIKNSIVYIGDQPIVKL